VGASPVRPTLRRQRPAPSRVQVEAVSTGRSGYRSPQQVRLTLARGTYKWMPTKKGSLKTYRGKRDFERTPEPRGRGRRGTRGQPRFVIHKHDASTLHYDFRLEAGNVLKSWAVPKGPSTDPREKRLAIPTEDHPLEYVTFEGTIPEGQYGAGPVIVWDTGTYENLTQKDGREVPVDESAYDGHVAVWLEGQRLSGGYALTRTGAGKRERWLLVKMKDKGADARRNPVKTQPESVISGKRIEDLSLAR
jgi:DNA ligase D-like protein (predicted 3'-phosphoesterase)